MMIVWNAKQSSASSIQFLVTTIGILVLSVVTREASIHAFTNLFLPTIKTNKRRYNSNSSNNSSFGHNNNKMSSKNSRTQNRNSEHELHEDRNPVPLRIFPHRLPRERRGTQQASREAFHHAVLSSSRRRPVVPKNKQNIQDYSLVVVTETRRQPQSEQPPQQRILLGKKQRGFGRGNYMAFGGKLFVHDDDDDDNDDGQQDRETIAMCACRELQEETNIRIPLEEMQASKVGIQTFTFADVEDSMHIHVFYIDLANPHHYRDPQHWSYTLQACAEITPRWFESFAEIPFDQMFADDSLWLTALLTHATAAAARTAATAGTTSTPPPHVGPPLQIQGSYYFAENCEDTNTILHYHMDVTLPSPSGNSNNNNNSNRATNNTINN